MTDNAKSLILCVSQAPEMHRQCNQRDQRCLEAALERYAQSGRIVYHSPPRARAALRLATERGSQLAIDGDTLEPLLVTDVDWFLGVLNSLVDLCVPAKNPADPPVTRAELSNGDQLLSVAPHVPLLTQSKLESLFTKQCTAQEVPYSILVHYCALCVQAMLKLLIYMRSL